MSGLSRTNSPSASKCHVFRDGGEWLVFLADQGLLFRTNGPAARMFRSNKYRTPAPDAASEPDAWAPTVATVSPTNLCGQACIYCYGTPAHQATEVIDLGFCERGLELIAANAARRRAPMRVFFHGVGEPTARWSRFTQCVSVTEQSAARHHVGLRMTLCTGGQLSESQAAYVADHFAVVEVSMDGPSDVQNAQRPRRDGKDSFVPAMRTAAKAAAAYKEVSVRVTVTDRTVARMPEFVEFVAEELGPVGVKFGQMFPLPWVDAGVCAPPDAKRFIRYFALALDAGLRHGVNVGHPDVSIEWLAAEHQDSDVHYCLTATNRLAAFYDVPQEGSAPPKLGTYGWHDPTSQTLVIDQERRREIAAAPLDQACVTCVCRPACMGPGGVKGRMPRSVSPGGNDCRGRIGALQELLRRKCPARPVVVQAKGESRDGRAH